MTYEQLDDLADRARPFAAVLNPDDPVQDLWVRVCPGTFIMGSPGPECDEGCTCGTGDGECQDPRCELEGCPGPEAGRYSHETQHQVTLTRPFLMKATELTQAEWSAMTWDGGAVVDPSSYSGDLRPVETVNWYEALAYCNWLSEQEGLEPCFELEPLEEDCVAGGSAAPADLILPGNDMECPGARLRQDQGWSKVYDCPGYRLPTEAEWEYAARAGTFTMFYETGDGEEVHLTDCDALNPVLDPIAVYACNDPGGTAEVGSKRANAWGLLDMSGNVYEWCWDRWTYGVDYDAGAGEDPVTSEGSSRVSRGGSWGNAAGNCRSANRVRAVPTYRVSSSGLRVVLCR